ncbi:MAG: Txe/YoeB family addiction module toxin [Verrucomicrobiota bacterium]|nr:Txe/YoeB family addiction module toxin [Verrucomicrobiota bacterium]
MNLVFSPQAWDDYQYWLKTDKKFTRRINELIRGTVRSHFEGIGKPEPLKHTLAGFWSRRINEEHRMVYRVAGKNLELAQLRFHY